MFSFYTIFNENFVVLIFKRFGFKTIFGFNGFWNNQKLYTTEIVEYILYVNDFLLLIYLNNVFLTLGI